MASPFPIVHYPCLPFPWSRYCFPPTSHIFHKCLTFSIYISHFPQMPNIVYICITFSTYISHYPQMLHIFHKCLHFSHILHISHQHMCSFFFFYFHAHSTVASLCSYIGASLRVINTSIARQGGYNQSIHRFLAVEKKDKDTTKGLVTNHWKSSYELKDGRQGLVWTTQIFLYCWLHQVL